MVAVSLSFRSRQRGGQKWAWFCFAKNYFSFKIFAWDPCWAFVRFLRTICLMGVLGLTRNFPPWRLVFVKNSSSSAAAFRFAQVWASSFPKIPKQFEESLSLRGVTFRERKALINFFRNRYDHFYFIIIEFNLHAVEIQNCE